MFSPQFAEEERELALSPVDAEELKAARGKKRCADMVIKAHAGEHLSWLCAQQRARVHAHEHEPRTRVLSPGMRATAGCSGWVCMRMLSAVSRARAEATEEASATGKTLGLRFLLSPTAIVAGVPTSLWMAPG